MIDTSVMVAGLVTNHEFHALARPHVAAAAQGRMPGIVLAETWAALRRAPWNLDARTVEAALSRGPTKAASWRRPRRPARRSCAPAGH